MAETVLVGILVGSSSDVAVMKAAAAVLDGLAIPCEMRIASAHRTPERVRAYAAEAAERGVKVIICGAGMAAHLAGVVASLTELPVVGVPLAGGVTDGLDALLSTAQMPAGVPVATVAVGEAGAKNAALLAARILALGDDRLKDRLATHRKKMADAVAAKDAELG